MVKKGVEYEYNMGKSEATYPIKKLESDVAAKVRKLAGIPDDAVVIFTSAPKGTNSDYGIPVVNLAKQIDADPDELVKNLADGFQKSESHLIESVSTERQYLNIKIDSSAFGQEVVSQILNMQGEYGHENVGKEDKVVIDMSSPNIAKRMGYPHLRSTIIGDALANILRAEGYEVVKDNHIGDWGTQFGKLIVAIEKWSNEDEVVSAEDPIGTLQGLYERFHKEAKKEAQEKREEFEKLFSKEGADAVPGLSKMIEQMSQEIMKRKNISEKELDHQKILDDALDKLSEKASPLEQEGRDWFLKLEQGNLEARRLWKLCVDISMKEFAQVYDFLGVTFDAVYGESFYESMLPSVAEEVKETVGKSSEGALVVDLQDAGLGVPMVVKSDGASLYMTRDLATALYRQNEMGAKKQVYVVGEGQKLYFQQLFEILKRMGHPIGSESVHVYFGTVSLPEGKKMSTREGTVILLRDVINEGIRRTEAILKDKNPELYANQELRDKVVAQITVGAMKWNDLAQDPKKTVVFDWKKALNLEGDSAPYVQYQTVRANKLITDSGLSQEELFRPTKLADTERVYQEESERELVKALAEFPNIIKDALDKYSPAKIAKYAFDLAQKFSSFYENVPVLKSENSTEKEARLKLVAATSQVLTNSLALLGIEVPERM